MEQNAQSHGAVSVHHQQQQQQQQQHAHKNTESQMPMQNNRKWSFGRLFRKNKKDVENNSSSEEDRKAGFTPEQKYARINGGSSNGSNANKLHKLHKTSNKYNSQRGSKYIGAGFDHIVVNQQQQQQQQNQSPLSSKIRQQLATKSQHIDNEFFLPVETITPKDLYYQQQLQQQQLKRNSRSTNSVEQRHSMMSARAAAASAAASPSRQSRSSQRLQSQTAAQVHSGMNTAAASSDEELISLNSSTFSKYRSDESIHSGSLLQQGGNNNMSRRSRAARNERYYKRLSRDGEISTGQLPQFVKPHGTSLQLSVYSGQPQQKPLQLQRSNHGSLQHVPTEPYMQWNQLKQLQQHQQQQQPQDFHGKKPLQNSLMSDNKRSISYDSHIHLQNINGHLQSKPLPPPPPPRDPMRRVNINSANNHNNNNNNNNNNMRVNCSAGDLRPLSYAFDPVQIATPTPTSAATPLGSNAGLSALNARCVSDDKIWAGANARAGHYQSENSSLNMSMPQSRRFITRAERDAQLSKQSLPNGIEFHYVADATPRSRKPIHLVEPEAGVLRTSRTGLPCSESTGNLSASSSNWRASDFWKRLDEGSQHQGRERIRTKNQEQSQVAVDKPRSISSSRVAEFRSYPIYTEIQKPKPKQQQQQKPIDEIDNVVCGSLHIKRADDKTNNYVEIRHKDVMNKSNSMPNHYNRNKVDECRLPLSNKYEQYVAEKREQQKKLSIQNPPAPPQRKLSIPTATLNLVPQSLQIPRKKPTNLEEAISELEAIYKSLGLTEPDDNISEEFDKLQKKPISFEVNDFDSYALAHADEYDNEEDSPAGEPDPVRDDVAYRNIKLANLQHKTNEKQLPFGIPIGPIVRAQQTDYLHVEPVKDPVNESHNAPDIVKDDLAVRALRKDPPGPKEPRFVYPSNSSTIVQKKNRATRTQSANIYSLIQRDAAKPSGGDMYSFLELTKNLDRCGSMSDLRKEENLSNADIPSTLKLLRNLKEQDQEQEQELHDKKKQIPFRHPSMGGAICQLPEKLIITEENSKNLPVPMPRKSLTPEPASINHRMEDALNKIAKDAQESSMKLSKELQELRKEALITHSRSKINCAEEEKLAKDLQEIEAVSEAAKRCGQLLLDTLPDATDNAEETAVKHRKLHKEGKLIKAIDQVSEAANAVCEKILKDMGPEPVATENTEIETPLTMPNLIKKLDTIQPDNIEIIAKRCMRQISELVASPDYDNLAVDEKDASSICTNKNTNNNNNNKQPAIISDKISKNADDTLISTVAEDNAKNPTIKKTLTTAEYTNKKRQQDIEEIDKIMQECEAQVRSEQRVQQTKGNLETYNHGGNAAACYPSSVNIANNAASSFSSSSDCLAKSTTSSSASRRQSSSITSFNPYSSSDYIKSPSSEFHAPSTDPIKTFSTTSYDVKSTSVTPNMTTSTFSYSPSPPPPPLEPLATKSLNSDSTTTTEQTVLTVENGRNSSSQERHSSSAASQYNSSEELAMIFGIKEKRSTSATTPHISGKVLAQSTLQSATQNSALSSTAIIKNTNTNNNNNYHASLLLNNNQCQIPKPIMLSNSCADSNNECFVKNNDELYVATTPTSLISHITPSSSNNPSTTNNNNIMNTTFVSTCKLDTIPEITIEQDTQTKNNVEQSSNYATKIKIVLQDIEELNSYEKISPNLLESFSSLEEISSKSDSGNDSLADYPMLANHAKNILLLQPAYNNRFEIKNISNAVDQIREIEEINLGIENKIEHNVQYEKNVDRGDKEFPPLPTAEELSEALGQNAHEKADLSRRGSIVYETPQLNMNISEVKLNYDYAAIEQPDMKINNAENANDNAQRQGAIKKDIKPENGDKKCMPERNATEAEITTVSQELNNRRKYSNKYIKTTTTTVLGEVRPTAVDAADNSSLTTLEHVLIACSLGIITPNDLFTLCLLIIGIITVLALVLL